MRGPVLVALATLTWWMTGCGGGSIGTPPPSSLSYPNAQHIVVGSAISLIPTVTGQVSSYAISPALQNGLSLSSTTGVISGTPTATLASTNYTVTATNAGGSATVSLTLQILNAPPSGLTYSQEEAVVGVSYENFPTVIGVVTSYSITPALPTGLVLNTTTGRIAGTPTTMTAAANYTVTATNDGGTTTATIDIQVRDTNVQVRFVGSPSTGNQITVVASSSFGLASVGATVQGISLGTIVAPTDPNIIRNFVFALPSTYVSGTYPVIITTTTATGVTEMYSGSITVNNPPVLTFSPKYGAIAYGNVTISGTATSDKPGGVGVQISLNGLPIYNTSTQNSYSFTYSLSGVPAGFTIFSVLAQDSSGGQANATIGIVVTTDPTEAELVPLVYPSGILAVDGANYLYSGFDGTVHLNTSAGDVVLQGVSSGTTGLAWGLSGGVPYASGSLSQAPGGSNVYTWPASGSAPVNLSAVAGDASQSDALLSVHDGWVFWRNPQSVNLFNLATQKATTIVPPQGESFAGASGNFFLAYNQLQLYIAGAVGNSYEAFQWQQATNAVTTVPGSAGAQFLQTDGTVVVWYSEGNIVVYSIASSTTTVLTNNAAPDSFFLGGGILAWVEGSPFQVKAWSEATGKTTVVSSTNSLVGAGGGYVILGSNPGIEAWNSSTGTTTVIVQSAADVFISGKTIYFAPIDVAPLSPVGSGYWYREVLP